MRRALLAVLLAWGVPAMAGYYAVITASNNSTYWPLNRTSGCYLLPSMAGSYIGTYSFSNGSVPYVSAVNTTDQTISYTHSNAYTWTVHYDSCTALPLTAAMPGYLGSNTDPALTNNTIASGSGSGTGTTTGTVTISNPVLSLNIPTQTDAEKVESFRDGMKLGWGVAGIMVIVYLIRRVHR